VTCSRCGEETSGPRSDHRHIEDCLDFLRLSVTQLNLYVARAELGAQAAQRRADALVQILREIAELAREDADASVLPSLLRRIRKLAAEQAPAPSKPSATR